MLTCTYMWSNLAPWINVWNKQVEVIYAFCFRSKNINILILKILYVWCYGKNIMMSYDLTKFGGIYRENKQANS